MSLLKKTVRILYIVYYVLLYVPFMAVITILTALVTIVTCAFFDDKIWGFYPAKIWSVLMCYMAFVRVEVKGREHIEKNQSYVFVANHQSMFDIYAVYGRLNVPFKWIMKKELESIPFVGKACKSAGHIFIPRGQNKAAKKCIEEAEKKLVNGLSVVIFPEGSRTHTGEIGLFKRGGFQIAADLQLPIIPITIKGAFEVMPRNSLIARPGNIKLIIHPKVETSHYINNQNELIQIVRQSVVDGF